MTVFEPILASLTASGVRFVVVGGVATVLHGHPRFTADLDLDLTADNPSRAVDALRELGLTPLLPVEEEAWLETSPEQRLAWLEDAVAFVRAAASSPPTGSRPAAEMP